MSNLELGPRAAKLFLRDTFGVVTGGIPQLQVQSSKFKVGENRKAETGIGRMKVTGRLARAADLRFEISDLRGWNGRRSASVPNLREIYLLRRAART